MLKAIKNSDVQATEQNTEATDLKSHLCDLAENMDNEIRALRAFSSLLNGHHDPGIVDLSEISFLVNPIIKRLEAIQGEFNAVFYGNGDVGN